MAKLKSFHVFCEVYGTNLFVVLGGDRPALDSLMQRNFKITVSDTYGDSESKARLGGCVMEFNKWPYHVLWLSGAITKTEILPKLSHEVFHHVLRVCRDKGIPTYPDIDNLIMDEPAAYLMEFYMREILKKKL
jgi:hypothetical protein